MGHPAQVAGGSAKGGLRGYSPETDTIQSPLWLHVACRGECAVQVALAWSNDAASHLSHRPGSQLKVRRLALDVIPYYHHGIYVGDDEVIKLVVVSLFDKVDPSCAT